MKKLFTLILVGLSLTACTIEEGNPLFGIVKRVVINPVNAVISTAVEVHYSEDREEDQELYRYLDMFVEDAAMHGIDLNYVYSRDINLHFGSWEPTLLSGLSLGYGRDDITIYINRGSWGYRSETHRKFLMYHELGHDIFNLRHGDTELLQPGTLSLDEDNADAILEKFWNHVNN